MVKRDFDGNQKDQAILLNQEETLSVVICTYNRAPLLDRLLADLEKQDGADALEIVVVDNHSSDSTPEVIQEWAANKTFFRFIPAFEGRRGYYAAARNVGLSHVTGKIVAFLDDDVRIPNSWARHVIQTFQETPDADGLGGPVEPDWEDPPPPDWVIPELFVCIGIGNYGDRRRLLEAREFPIGANMAFRTRALRDLGGFDPRVGYMGKESIYNDEVELVTRMRRNGSKIYYDPGNIAFHLVPRTRVNKNYFVERRKIDGRSIAVVELLQRGKVVLLRNMILRSIIGITRDLTALVATLFWKKKMHFVYLCRLAKTVSYIKTAYKILVGRSTVRLS